MCVYFGQVNCLSIFKDTLFDKRDLFLSKVSLTINNLIDQNKHANTILTRIASSISLKLSVKIVKQVPSKNPKLFHNLQNFKDFWKLLTEALTHWCSVKKVFLEISQNPQENTCARISFLIKLQAWGLQLYQKRDSRTIAFLWILRNF